MTEIQIPWAPGAAYIHIVCRLGRIVPDGPDIDDSYPDLVTQGGKVKLVCSVDWVRYSETDTRRRWLDLSSSWEYGIRPEDGELFNPETGAVGVGVLSGETAGMDPGGFTWRATVSPAKGKSFTVVIPTGVENFDLVDAIDTPSVTPQLTSTLTPRVAALEARVTAAPPAAVAPATQAQAPALERLRALRAFGVGRVRVAVVGDSTGNADNEWVRLWSRKFGSTLPSSVGRTYRAWNGSAWGAEIVDAAPPALVDTFTRTGAIAGSAPDQGPAWSGSADWTADGGKAVLTSGLGGAVISNLGARVLSAKTNLVVVTTKPADTQLMRIYASTGGGGSGLGVWLALSVGSGGGALTASLNKTVSGGTTTTLEATKAVAGAVFDSATPLPVEVTITVTGDVVTATTVAAGQTTTWTGTLAAGDAAGFGTYYSFGSYGPTTTYPFAFAVDRVEVAAATGFEIWNGSIAGATPATFDATLRASMFGANPFEIVVLNFGHNGAQTGAQFVTTISDWVAAWATEHPESVPLLMSQNPQKAPAGTIARHAARLAALRGWAAEKRHPYIPVWETFRARADKGDPLVLADGIHPTTPPGSDLTGDYGSVLWADTVLAATS